MRTRGEGEGAGLSTLRAVELVGRDTRELAPQRDSSDSGHCKALSPVSGIARCPPGSMSLELGPFSSQVQSEAPRY